MVSIAAADAGPAAKIGDTDFLALPEDARRVVRSRVAWVLRVASAPRGTIGLAEAEASSALAASVQTVRRWVAGYRASGGDWRSLLDGRLKAAGARGGLPGRFVELWRTLCESENRCCKSAHVKLRAMWSSRDPALAAIPEYSSFPGWPKLPPGWCYRNLVRPRYRPTNYELAACRVGRSAAAAHRPKVIRTRRGLYPGAFYLFDDVWADVEVNVLDTRRRGRPVEFGALDLYSGCRFAWGTKVRTKNDEGKAEYLNDAQFRFLLAMVVARDGIDPDRGTTAVVEHGAAKIGEDLERDLHDATAGKFRVARGGIQGAPAMDCQWRGPSRGNPRMKAPLESLHHLMHNRAGDLPGQTGANSRLDEPEQMHGLRRYNDALLVAMGLLPPDRAASLRLPLLEFGQYLREADAIYAAINSRTDHRLEGWDGLYVPDPVNGGMRRMSPAEVWDGRRLAPAPPAAVAAILFKFRQERTVRGNEIAFQDCEVSADPMRFDCSGASGGIAVRDGEKVDASLNPFFPHALYCHDARGRFLGVAPRVHAARWGDVEATRRALGRVAKIEAGLLAPLRRRHQDEARRRLAMREHNARALDLSAPHTPAERRIAERAGAVTREDIDALISSPADAPEGSRPAPADGGEELSETPVAADSSHPQDTEDLIDMIL